MKQARKILLASAGDELRMLLDRALHALADVELETAPQAEPRALNGKVAACDALLVEVDAAAPGAADTFIRLAEAVAERKVIAAVRNAGPEDVRRLFRAGAADVLTAPFTPAALQASLGEVLGGLEPGRPAGAVVSVVRGCGGVGATTVALNLAALAARPERKGRGPGKSVAVLDLDLQFGDADLALNLEPRSTILDVLRAEQRFDGRLLQGALVDHACGVKLLASPPKPIPLEALNPAFATQIVSQTARLHDYTFIDLPCVWTDWTLPILRQSSRLVLVTTPTVQGALAARRLLDALAEAEIDTPSLLVLNRLAGVVDAFEKPSRLRKSLDRPIDAALSLDPTAVRAFDRGVLLADGFPNARLTRELRALAAKLAHGLAAAEPGHAERQGAAA